MRERAREVGWRLGRRRGSRAGGLEYHESAKVKNKLVGKRSIVVDTLDMK